jgi:error-prone DNA polymerase
LCTLITRGRRAAGKGAYHLTRDDVTTGLKRCLVIVIPGTTELEETCIWAAASFPSRAWLALARHAGPDDASWLALLQQVAARAGLRCVATGGAHMHARSRRVLQDLVTAVRHRCTLEEARPFLHANGDRHLRPRAHLARMYPRDAVAESVAIAARCQFSLDELRYEYPEEIVPAGHTPPSWLRALTEAGIQRRWPDGVAARVRQQIEDELAIIAQLRYEPYFLTVYDIVAFARDRGILDPEPPALAEARAPPADLFAT